MGLATLESFDDLRALLHALMIAIRTINSHV